MASKVIQVAVRGREKCFNSPLTFFKILLDKIQFSSVAMTIHIIFHCFLETQKFTMQCVCGFLNIFIYF